jgi:hypothetical protein
MSARADVAAGLLLPPQTMKGASSGALQTSPNDTLVSDRASPLPGRARAFGQSREIICAPVVRVAAHVSQVGIESGLTWRPPSCLRTTHGRLGPPLN